MWGGGGATEDRKKELLAACYRSALARADENKLASIAFPAIGTGIYGWPIALGAEIALREVRAHLAQCSVQKQIVVCCFSDLDRALYQMLIEQPGG